MCEQPLWEDVAETPLFSVGRRLCVYQVGPGEELSGGSERALGTASLASNPNSAIFSDLKHMH